MVYVILADGFEEIEALTPVDFLRRAGAEVVTVGITGPCPVGAHGIPVKCDIDAAETDIFAEVPEMVVFPGGMPGASNIDTYSGTDRLISDTLSSGGYVGAICAAPMILGKRGVLEGKRAVCFPGFEEHLHGAVITDCDAVRDGNVVTSRCMGTAMEFSFELAACLFGRVAAEKTLAAVMAKKQEA